MVSDVALKDKAMKTRMGEIHQVLMEKRHLGECTHHLSFPASHPSRPPYRGALISP
jgi:hypothetical protein